MAVQTATKPEGPTGEFKGDIEVDNTPPNAKMIAKADGLVVLDKDKKKHTFKSLHTDSGRVLIVFIRHFFCGNCQEYIRTLATDLPPPSLLSLSTPTSLLVIGCGSPDLIPMYVRETSCPYPVYADPARKVYSVLGMTRTLSLGNKSPQYMRQPLYRVAFQSVIQELRSGKNMLSGGDFWQVGGEFVFESQAEGGGVSWCHRMRNTRDHAELAELKRELKWDGDGESESAAVPPGKPIGSRRSIGGAGALGAGLVRKMSDKRRSWRRSMSRSRSRNTEPHGRAGEKSSLERLKEEDGGAEGGREDALRKLEGGANGNTGAVATSEGVLNGGVQKEGEANGVTEKPAVAPAAEDTVVMNGHANGHVAKPVANGSIEKPTANGAAGQPLANGSALESSAGEEKPVTNGSAANNTSKISDPTVDGIFNTNGHVTETLVEA